MGIRRAGERPVQGNPRRCVEEDDWPKGSIEQQIGDYYGACMDEKRLNELGMKPIQPMLAEIDAIKTQAIVQKMIGKMHDLEMQAPFFLLRRRTITTPRR